MCVVTWFTWCGARTRVHTFVGVVGNKYYQQKSVLVQLVISITNTFHSKCDNKGYTLTVVETISGNEFGGYSNTAWSSTGGYARANKAFLFALSGGSILSPCKMKLKDANYKCAIYCGNNYGQIFGDYCDHDMNVNGSNVYLLPRNNYD